MEKTENIIIDEIAEKRPKLQTKNTTEIRPTQKTKQTISRPMIKKKKQANCKKTQKKKKKLPDVVVSEGVTVPLSSEVKSLGVILDNKLTWESHISLVNKKVNRVLYALRFIRQCTNKDLRFKLLQALVVSHLDYCSVVYLDCSTNLKDIIQRLSNICLRYIYIWSRQGHTYCTLQTN